MARPHLVAGETQQGKRGESLRRLIVSCSERCDHYAKALYRHQFCSAVHNFVACFHMYEYILTIDTMYTYIYIHVRAFTKVFIAELPASQHCVFLLYMYVHTPPIWCRYSASSIYGYSTYPLYTNTHIHIYIYIHTHTRPSWPTSSTRRCPTISWCPRDCPSVCTPTCQEACI